MMTPGRNADPKGVNSPHLVDLGGSNSASWSFSHLRTSIPFRCTVCRHQTQRVGRPPVHSERTTRRERKTPLSPGENCRHSHVVRLHAGVQTSNLFSGSTIPLLLHIGASLHSRLVSCTRRFCPYSQKATFVKFGSFVWSCGFA